MEKINDFNFKRLTRLITLQLSGTFLYKHVKYRLQKSYFHKKLLTSLFYVFFSLLFFVWLKFAKNTICSKLIFSLFFHHINAITSFFNNSNVMEDVILSHIVVQRFSLRFIKWFIRSFQLFHVRYSAFPLVSLLRFMVHI